MGKLKAPQLLDATHDVSAFECEHPELADWLKRHALANQARKTSRVYVVCEAGTSRVVGFYSLAPGAVVREAAPKNLQRNTPDPIPVILLGRLAVDVAWAGQGVGTGMLKDALLRALSGANIIGGRALLCHAIDEKAKAFYLKHGFTESPIQPLTVMLPIDCAL